jgi:anti-sigma factor RsiW
MTCEEFTQALTAFSLNELDPPQAAAARAHLAGCPRCTNLALRDHQLVSRLRAAAVPAPATVHHAVAVALRKETREFERRRRRPFRAVVGGLAASAAVLLVFATLAFDARRDEPQTPLAAAWGAYSDGDLRFDPGVDVPASLLTLPLPDLGKFGLLKVHDGSLRLAGEAALATEYRGPGGAHFTVFRWEGQLPNLTQGNPGGDPPSVITSSWEGTTSSWWNYEGVVFCAVGNLPRPELDAAVDHIRGAHNHAT